MWFSNHSEQFTDKAYSAEKLECTLVHEDFEVICNDVRMLCITNDLLRFLQLSQMAGSYISRLMNHFKSLAGLPALHFGEPGQVRKEAATANRCKCRG